MLQPASVAAFAGTVGSAITVASIIAIQRTIKFMRIALETDAVVTELVKTVDTSSGRYSKIYTPAFYFDAQDGQTWRVLSNVGTSSPCYKVGDKIRIVYDPAHPTKARIHGWMELWGPAIVGSGFGLAFIAFALSWWFVGRP